MKKLLLLWMMLISFYASADIIYVIGYVNGKNLWESNNGFALSGENNVYEGIVTLTAESSGDAYFGFTKKLGDWDTTNSERYGSTVKNNETPNFSGSNNIGKNQNVFKVSGGTYYIKVNLSTMKMDISLIPDKIYLIGNVNGNSFAVNTGIEMSHKDGIYTGSYNFTNSNDGFSYFYFGENRPNSSWDVGTAYGAENDGTDISNGNEFYFWHQKNAFKLPIGNYTVTVNLKKNTISVSYNHPIPPASGIYMYGHVNNLYWDPKNYIKLDPTSESGVYKTENADISGIWSAADLLDDKPERKLNESTDGENYIAFYENIVSDFNGKKYGSKEEHNILISDDVTGGDLVYRDAYLGYNFQVPDGLYDVTVNLNDNTVSFIKLTEKEIEDEVPVQNVTYTWYMGEKDPEMIDHEEGHSLTFGDEKSDIIQVGLGENPGHRVARQAVYEVKYREPNYVTANAKQIKAYADDQEVLDRDSEGYYTAREGKEIITIGSENYADNHLIQLISAGDYQITATLHDDAQNVDEYNVQPTTLSVNVAQASVDVTGANDATTLTKKFENTTAGIKYDQAIIIKSSDTQTIASSITTSDFTVEIVPKNNAEGWAKVENYSSTTDVDAVYKEQLPASLYDQYLSAKGEGLLIDGLYTEVSKLNVEADEDTPGTFNVTAVFPCSGVYEMIVTPVSTGNATFEATTIEYTITPNLDLMYGSEGKVAGMNINGVSFVSGEGKFYYPYNEDGSPKTPKQLNPKASSDDSFVYTPGLYFAESFDVAFTNSANSIKRYAEENNTESDGIYWGAPIDISKAPENGFIKATVTKNGAEGTNSFTFTLNNTNTTAVDGIEPVEDGEAVYYNLQGVKVENPEHGIYVKVVNGKASKVVL